MSEASTEKICTLSIDHAIRIAKIIATAPIDRMPMITQLFHQASVDLEGLDEMVENSRLTSQGTLIDTDEFIRELTLGREETPHGFLFTAEEFNQFCLDRSLQPRLVKRHLFAKGLIEGTKEGSGKVNYSITVYVDGASQRRVAVKGKDMAEKNDSGKEATEMEAQGKEERNGKEKKLQAHGGRERHS